MTTARQETRAPCGFPPGDRLRCRPEDVLQFLREMETMVASGIPILQVLQAAGTYREGPLARVLSELSAGIRQGSSLSSAMQKFSSVFSPLMVTMVRIGEETGRLPGCLGRLVSWLERDLGTRKKVASALTYPTFALLLTGLLTAVVFYTVMPTFVALFEQMSVELPWCTRLLVGLTWAVTSPGVWVLLLAATLLGLVPLRSYLQSGPGRRTVFRLLGNLPVVGRLIYCSTLARFAAAMGATLGTGTDLVSSLRLAASASGSPLLERDSREAVAAVRQGQRLSEHMARRPELYEAPVRQFTLAAEESSRVPEFFERLAAHYDQEVDYRVQVLGAILEPVLMSLVALVVGFIVISVFLPLYSYLGKLG